jgi:thiosulfate dehydrogenase [quinone] large subunit
MTTQVHPRNSGTIQRPAEVVPDPQQAVAPADLSSIVPVPAAAPAVTTTASSTRRGADIALAALRIATGAVFLWAFLDKLFGLGYSTPGARSWLSGGSPTEGFLSHVEVGPLQGLFTSIAGAWWADWLFMLGLVGIGIAMILGIGTRIAAVAGVVMMALMWLAEYPLARFNSSGDATGSTNPIFDYHLIYALALIALAATAAGAVWGLGRWWSALPIVQRHPWLR